MRTKLNIMIGLQIAMVVILAIGLRFQFTIFYQSLSDFRRCDWNWSDGMSGEECRSAINRRAVGMETLDPVLDGNMTMDANLLEPLK